MTTSLVKFDISDIKRSIISHDNCYGLVSRQPPGHFITQLSDDLSEDLALSIYLKSIRTDAPLNILQPHILHLQQIYDLILTWVGHDKSFYLTPDRIF